MLDELNINVSCLSLCLSFAFINALLTAIKNQEPRMSRLLKAVNKSSPKIKRTLGRLRTRGMGKKKSNVMRQSTARQRGFFLKKQSPRLFPHIGSLISSTTDIFPPPPAQMRWRPRPSARSDGKPPLFARRRGSDGTRATTERGNHARGTDRQKKSFIVHSCFATQKRASERPLDGQSRGSHHEPATTGIISASRIIASHTHLAEATG
jgi:hypothetical protein